MNSEGTVHRRAFFLSCNCAVSPTTQFRRECMTENDSLDKRSLQWEASCSGRFAARSQVDCSTRNPPNPHPSDRCQPDIERLQHLTLIQWSHANLNRHNRKRRRISVPISPPPWRKRLRGPHLLCDVHGRSQQRTNRQSDVISCAQPARPQLAARIDL